MPVMRGWYFKFHFHSQLVNMGLELRDHVHEIEFLSVVAFVAREIQMALPSKSPYTRFTPQDLDMAYAFQMKYGEMQHMCCCIVDELLCE